MKQLNNQNFFKVQRIVCYLFHVTYVELVQKLLYINYIIQISKIRVIMVHNGKLGLIL